MINKEEKQMTTALFIGVIVVMLSVPTVAAIIDA